MLSFKSTGENYTDLLFSESKIFHVMVDFEGNQVSLNTCTDMVYNTHAENLIFLANIYFQVQCQYIFKFEKPAIKVIQNLTDLQYLKYSEKMNQQIRFTKNEPTN